MNKVVTFGEVILRLSPPGNKKMQQTNTLEFYFGGTEMNVAASLANFGMQVAHVTNVSNDMVGDAALAFLKQHHIQTQFCNRVPHPLGLYFMEIGAALRSSKISYNRLHGAFANIQPNEIDWEEVFKNCSIFHWTGITPGISESAYHTLLQGLKIAAEKKITITTDPTYRSNLWKYGKEGKTILKELLQYTTIFIGGIDEINLVLNQDFLNTKEDFIKASEALIAQFPNIQKIVEKLRSGSSASVQKISARAFSTHKYYEAKMLTVENVVDRIGTGDAFAAGIIYALQHFNLGKTLDFAVACSALKHTIPGDVNLATVEEVLEICAGNINGRIKR
ncbi:sugar kinase [Zhouia sp. PK063]|uniref:sugar kinase n=1 Tax=Zhouia sp. PK063 TaxID=3373602 RepID=UPI0037A5C5CC